MRRVKSSSVRARRYAMAGGILWCSAALADPVSPALPAPPAAEATPQAPGAPASRLPRTAQLNLEKLEQLQAETLLYEAQLNRDKALRELLTTPPDSTPAVASPGTTVPATAKQAAEPRQEEPEALPRVREITGTGTQLTALLRLADNSLVQIKPGSRIPGTGLTVTSLSAQGVRVTGQENREQTLPFDN